MKTNCRALSLLLSMVMVLTFMPTMAFAADSGSKIPESIEFVGDTEFTPEYTDKFGDKYNKWFELEKEGNKIIINYQDGSSTYECKQYTWMDSDGSTIESYAFVPAGEKPKLVKDEAGDYYAENALSYVDWEFVGSDNIEITIEYDYINEYGNEDWDDISTTIQGKYVKEMKYTGEDVTYDSWDGPKDSEFYTDGREFTLYYSDGTTRKIVTKPYAEYSEDGDTWKEYDWFFEDEKPIVKTDEDGDKFPQNFAELDIDWENYDESKGVPVIYHNVSTYVPLKENVYATPVSAEFVPSEGFVGSGIIGDKYIYFENLYGTGNKFVITYSDHTKKEFVYGKRDGEYGFHCGDKGLWSVVFLNKRIPEGTNELSGEIEVEGAGYQNYSLPVKVKIKATQYYVDVVHKNYTYTGKPITHKPVVKYWTGSKFKTMPKSWYTVKALKKSKIGGYWFKVKIKKKYQKKYGQYIWGSWSIVPKTPVIKKTTGGSGKLTVTWSKFNKAAQKNINGFVVEVSTSSKFSDKETEYYYVDKKKASKYTVKGLTKGKKYYVRVMSYKEKDEMIYWSKPSKKKSAKVK